MGDVVILKNVTRLDLPPERIIDAAAEAGLTAAVIIGYDADGDFYFASSKSDGADVLWLLETAKKRLLETGGA